MMGSQIYTFTSTSTETVGESQRQFLGVPYVKLTLAMDSVLLNSMQKFITLKKQGSYRLWNSGKTMEFLKGNSIYGKTMEFSFWWKKVCAFKKKKKWGENMSGLRNVVSMFVASAITSLGLALRTSRAVALTSAE